MTPANTRSARAALDAVRPLIARLDDRRHPEDAAADLIEGWAGVETALREMVGGSSLGGQALVSDVRAAGLLDYPHAHALLGFLAARDRATRPDYHPSAEDAEAARAGFQAIEAANGTGIAADTATHPTPTQTPPQPRQDGYAQDGYTQDGHRQGPYGQGTTGPDRGPLLPPPPAPTPPARGSTAMPYMRPNAAAAPPPPLQLDDRQPLRRTGRSPVLLVGVVVFVLALAAGAYALFRPGGRSRDLDAGIAAYQAGRRDEARRDFQEAARNNPRLALPHVFLGRMAREDGDVAGATSELTTALQLEPRSAAAAREMGSAQLVAGQPALAVRFFTRALEADGTDRLASGGMACALMQQGNAVAADRFFARAGSGPWAGCRQMAPGTPVPGGAVPTAGAPPGP